MSGFSYTLVEALNPPILTKRFELADGRLEKISAGNLMLGEAAQVRVPDLERFGANLEGLRPSQATIYGIAADHPKARIVTTAKHAAADGAITRTRRYFGFARAGGCMFLDYDHPKDTDERPPAPEELIDRLRTAAPSLRAAPMLWRPSASAGVCTADGSISNGLVGQRLYIPVRDAALIPDAGTALVDLLWAAGLGRIEVGRAGQALERTLADSAVWQPERLDFAAAPVLGPGLQRIVPPPWIAGDAGVLFDLRLLIEEHNGNVIAAAVTERKRARAARAEDLRKAREAWLDEHAPVLAAKRNISADEARGVLALAAGKFLLTGDFVLLGADGKEVPVGHLLDNPAKWHAKRFADPLEPDYDEDRRIAWANLRGGARPHIYSHAHGGRRFHLVRPSRSIEIRKGRRAQVVDALLDLTRERGELYDFGQDCVLVRIADDGRALPCDVEWTSDHLDRIARFYRIAQTKDGPKECDEDAPPWSAKRIMSKRYERGLQRLEAVINGPTIRADGSLLLTPGYDPATRLLYISDAPDVLHVPQSPTIDEARKALATLTHPFRAFPLVADVDRGVMLAALLTAVVRAALPTAHGFGFDAPAAGTGKTLLAQAIGALVTGQPPAALAPAGSKDDEARKRLFAALIGGERTLLWDNVSDPLGNAALDAFLTAASFSDRVLGRSEMLTLPNRALFLATGNNLRLVGDTCRRILVARLDARVEKPYAREFDWCPRATAVARRDEMIIAALTLIRAHIAAAPSRRYTGRSASFEDWDRMVREVVCWVADWDHDGEDWYADPLEATARAFENDPDSNKLAALLHGWRDHVGSNPITSAQLVASVLNQWGSVKKGDDGEPEPAALALHEAMVTIAGDRRGTIDVRHLGNWIRMHLDRRIDGLRITQYTNPKSRTREAKKWQLAEDDPPKKKSERPKTDPVDPVDPAEGDGRDRVTGSDRVTFRSLENQKTPEGWIEGEI